MPLGRPLKALEVTVEEKEKLTMLARRPKSAQAMAMRAHLCWGVRRASLTELSPSDYGSPALRFANGGSGFGWSGWKDCWTNLARERRARLPTSGWRKSSPKLWRRCPLTAPIGPRV